MEYVVKDLAIASDEAGFAVSVMIEAAPQEEPFWYRVTGGPLNLDTADAFFAPCLLMAMKSGAAIRFSVPISSSIMRGAEDLAFIMGVQLGLDCHTPIQFDDIREDRAPCGSGSIAGFSCGIDSWFTLHKHYLHDETPDRITHLLFNDIGANITATKSREALVRARIVADRFGLPLWHVESNMAQLLSLDFQSTHTLRNASVAHLFASVADRFLYASADTYRVTEIRRGNLIARADPVLLPLLSTQAMRLHSSGSTYTRHEKTRAIVDLPGTRDILDVCIRHDHDKAAINCGECWKCLRTLMSLEALGVLDHYGEVFDLDAYRGKRLFGISQAYFNGSEMDREAVLELISAGRIGLQEIRRAKLVRFAARRLNAGRALLSRI